MLLAQGLDRLCVVESAVNNAICFHFGLEPFIGLIVAVEDCQWPVWMGLLQLLGQWRLEVSIFDDAVVREGLPKYHLPPIRPVAPNKRTECILQTRVFLSG